jgi:hypothetical protein
MALRPSGRGNPLKLLLLCINSPSLHKYDGIRKRLQQLLLLLTDVGLQA